MTLSKVDSATMTHPPLYHVLGMKLHGTSYQESAALVCDWAQNHESRTVCAANVHMVMESYDRPDIRRAVNSADLITPDGMPLVWTLRLEGFKKATRVYGPDLTPVVLQMAEKRGIPVGFYGGDPAVLETLLARVAETYPRLSVVFAQSPPFRQLTLQEDRDVVKAIRRSGARILFIGLGCPKQETWMAEHRGQINAVMLGVGAAFDFLAGSKPQCPGWLRSTGLEWVFRFATEPRRLWKRYMKHNPRFVALVTKQLLGRPFRRQFPLAS